MRKTVLTIVILFLATSISTAQQRREVHSSRDSIRTTGLHEIGWMHSHLLDNWFLEVNGGGQMYFGFEDNKAKPLDRITPKSEVHLGHWLFPSIGLRGNLGMADARGFISLDSYMAQRTYLTRDFGTCWGLSTSDTTIGGYNIRGSMGGYYHPYDDNLLIQKWRYLYGGFDVLINLSYLKRMDNVRLDRRRTNILYAGFHIRYGITEKHPEKINQSTNAANEGHIGYICNWNIIGGLNFKTDIRLSIMEGDFDRERIEGVEKFGPDLEVSFLAGLSYDFNLRTNKARRRYYVERGKIDYATNRVPRFIALKQIEDVIHVTRTDTILLYQKYEKDSPEIAEYLDSLRREVEKAPISENTPLDSILINHMLPYEMVFFDLDKWDIRPSEEMKIARMAQVMKAYPNSIFHLYGSADAKTGTFKRNTFLSHNRADMVYNRLILEYGIPARQLRRDYLGGINDFEPFILNRTTVIIMDHPTVQKAFLEMKSQHKAGGKYVDMTGKPVDKLD